MRYVLAWAKPNEIEKYKNIWYNHYLITQIDRKDIEKTAPLLKKWDSLIIDSWAFTAWTKWKHIDIDEYAKFCVWLNQKYWNKFELNFVNLDEIPWRFGRRPTQQEREKSAEVSYKQWHYLKTHYPNLTWMPVFHQHEDFKWLKKYIDEDATYIGISPANDLRPVQRLAWLKVCYYKYIIPSGKKIKTHWLWVTTFSILKEIPFFSCDSTTWKDWPKYNAYFIFSKWILKSFQAKDLRNLCWIDFAKMTTEKKIDFNLKELWKMSDYITKLHLAKWMEYWIE